MKARRRRCLRGGDEESRPHPSRGDLTSSGRADRGQRRSGRSAREGAPSRGGSGCRCRRRRPAGGTGGSPCPHHRRRPDSRGHGARARGDDAGRPGGRRRALAAGGLDASFRSLAVRRRVPCRTGLSDSRDRRPDRRGHGRLRGARISSSRHRRRRAGRRYQASRDSLGAHRRGGEPVRRLAASHLARAGAYGIEVAARLVCEGAGRRPHGSRGRGGGRPGVRIRSFGESRGRRGGSCPIRLRTPPSPQRVPGCWRRRSRRSSRTFHPTSRTPNGVRPDQVLGCARTDHGNDDAEHGACRGAVAARGSRRVVRVPRVHPRSIGNAIFRARALGVGAPVTAPACGAREALAASSCRCLIAARTGGDGRGW